MFTMFFWMISASKISPGFTPRLWAPVGAGGPVFFLGAAAHRQVGSTEGRKSDVGVGLKMILKHHQKYHRLSWIIIENIMDYHGWGLVAMIFPKMMGMGFSKTWYQALSPLWKSPEIAMIIRHVRSNLPSVIKKRDSRYSYNFFQAS